MRGANEMLQITEMKARNIKPGSKPVADGTVAGLRLEPGRTRGRGKWILRFVSPVTGKRREMGLGVYPATLIADARTRGLTARQLIGSGKDPIDERDAATAARKATAEALTFEHAALKVHEELKPGWKNPKHADQWISTLRQYAFPKISKKKVASLAPTDFAEMLRPIWLDKPETASRIKQRCHTILKWCWAHGFVQSNPLDVVDFLLPQQPGKRERTKHHAAMPWQDVPDFVSRALSASDSNATRALLEFVILTAARSGEARAMTWGEIDLKEKVWTIPASRMKAKVQHRVPLSTRAVAILKSQRRLYPEADLVFPSPRGLVLCDMALTSFLRSYSAHSGDQGRVATAHGFRSSFRDWASENGYPRDLAERALAHTIANQAEAAYHRTDLLERRRNMMENWADHVGGLNNKGQVIPMLRGA